MSHLILSTITAQSRALRGYVGGITGRLMSDERGQDAIEYVGVLVIVAAVIGVLLVVVGKIEPGLESSRDHRDRQHLHRRRNAEGWWLVDRPGKSDPPWKGPAPAGPFCCHGEPGVRAPASAR